MVHESLIIILSAGGSPIDTDTLTAGQTLDVSASFSDSRGGPTVTCSATYTAVADRTIGCGPIEIGYQATTGTCVLICN